MCHGRISRSSVGNAPGGRSRRRHPSRQPSLDLAVPIAAVLAFRDPVVLLGKHDQPGRHLEALLDGEEHDRVVHGHAEILLAHREEQRRDEPGALPAVRALHHRALLAPHLAVAPDRAAAAHLAAVDPVARAPLHHQVGLAGMRDDAPVPRGRRLQPIRQVAAVARAGRRLARRVEKGVPPQRRVGRLVDLPGRTPQRVELDVLGELLPVTGRARVIRQQDAVAGRGQQVVVPPRDPGVAPHAGGAAVDQHQERILPRRVEGGRPHEQAVDAPAAAALKPEMLDRREIERGHLLVVEAGQGPRRRAVRADRIHLRRMGGRLPVRQQRAPARRQAGERSGVPELLLAEVAAGEGSRVELLAPRVLGREPDAAAAGGQGEAADRAVEGCREHFAPRGVERPGKAGDPDGRVHLVGRLLVRRAEERPVIGGVEEAMGEAGTPPGEGLDIQLAVADHYRMARRNRLMLSAANPMFNSATLSLAAANNGPSTA